VERIFIAGCGDIGRRVAQLALARGASVGALCRSLEQNEQLQTRGIDAVTGHLGSTEGLANLPCAGATVFYFVPPAGGGHGDVRAEQFCAAMGGDAPPQRLIYLSTSGVYGDTAGRPAEESMVPQPLTARARRRLHAEQTFRRWGKQRGVPVITLRVTNIYGPGRLPIVHLRSGHPLLAAQDSRPTCRIHSDDLAQVCLTAAERGRGDEVYNLCDNDPCSATRYFELVAELLGIACPPQISLEEARRVMKPLLFSYFIEARLMNNSKMLNELGVTLLYPRLREGIVASLSDRPGGD
jgi:nucleoside-diphosphate-sugar epimerase